MTEKDNYRSTSSLNWDDFLTDRDKEYLSQTDWTKKEPFGFGSRPAVLVVDDYYASVGIERLPILESIRSWPKSCGSDGWDAIDVTARILEVARGNDVFVAHVKRLKGMPRWGNRPTLEWPDHVSVEDRQRADDIVDEVRPEPGEPVFEKSAPSAFAGTPLRFWLVANAIDTLIVCGESTSGCVRATVVDGATHRYRMGIVSDACFDRLQANHWINLFDMNQKYGDVIDSNDAITYLKSL